MPAIFVHGLGQTSEAWNEVISRLPNSGQNICPNLPELIWGSEASYQNLYRAFAKFCNAMDGRVDLCGLSLGGVLALNYTIDYPEKVNSLVLIAAQYRMPKNLLRFQNTIFRFMPQAMFAQMGFGKRDFLQLCKTMMELDFSTSLPQISCPVLVVCGEKDSTNAKASAQLAQQIKAAEYRIIAGTGHEVNMEASEKLARIINDFFAGGISTSH